MLGLGQQRIGLGLAQTCLGCVHCRLEHTRIDHKQWTALGHELPFGHADTLQIATDSRAQLNLVDGGQRTGVLHKRRHRTRHHLGYRHARGLGGCGWR